MKRLPLLVITVLAMIVLAACGNDASPGASSDSDESTEPGESEAPQPSAAAEEVTQFSVVSNSGGPSDYPLLAAIDALNAQGWDVQFYQITAGADVAADGVARGDFATGSGAINVYLAAIQAGAPIEIVAARNVNAWYLYARNAITSCEELDGVKLAIHSEASSSTALVRQYIAENCPEAEPEYLVIAGSENRFAAMIADEIDAAPVEAFDAMALDREAGDRYSALVSFAEALPDLYTNSQVFNKDFADANPGTVTGFLKAVLEQYQMIDGNPDYFAELDAIYGDPEAPLGDESLEFHADGFFPVDGGLTPDGMQYILDYFTAQGSIEEGLTIEDVADLSYLDAANAELGN